MYEHVVSLPLLPSASGPLASHLFFHPIGLPAHAHLQLNAADMISHSLINWENQSKEVETAIELPIMSSTTDCVQ